MAIISGNQHQIQDLIEIMMEPNKKITKFVEDHVDGNGNVGDDSLSDTILNSELYN